MTQLDDDPEQQRNHNIFLHTADDQKEAFEVETHKTGALKLLGTHTSEMNAQLKTDIGISDG